MRAAAGLRAALVAVALTWGLAGCSSTLLDPTGATSTPPRQIAVPADVQHDIEQAVDSFNAAAGGSVSGQRTALAALLAGGQRSVQRRCAAASTTLEFEPVYGRLAPAPGWTPSQGTLDGTVYALPTLIRIYTGNRITGTDLTDLHLAVQDGRAWLPALCPD